MHLESITDDLIRYQTQPNEALKQRLLSHLSLYIRNFPKLAFKVWDEDIQSDFYLYVYERFDSLLKKYQANQGKFSTYLSLRLKTYYLNFYNQKKNFERIEIHTTKEDTDDFAYLEKHDLELLSLADSGPLVEEAPPNGYEKLMNNPLSRLILKLYDFNDFDEEDFCEVAKQTGKPYGEIMQAYEEIRSAIWEKKQAQLKCEEKLQKIYRDILDLHQKVAYHSTKNDSKPQTDDQTIETKLNEKRNKILKRYYQIKTTPPIKLIAKMLNLKEDKVANIISYQKAKLSTS